ncbi:MAG: SRPBCC domain-containing protein [Saprospiraceae bacterium]|nr:SRPBCC domain-containing protein [Saprospiraceae bacterium]
MEFKTKINAADGRQELFITREFDLPLKLLFKAYQEPEIIEQWMGTRVERLENKSQGGYQFITIDPRGNEHVFQGVYHEFIPDSRIIRTFQMMKTPFPVQLEFLEFEEIDSNTSKLTIQIIYKSVEDRDKMLELPFAYGINMAHNKLQQIVQSLK